MFDLVLCLLQPYLTFLRNISSISNWLAYLRVGKYPQRTNDLICFRKKLIQCPEKISTYHLWTALYFQFIAYNIHLLLGLTTSTALTDSGLWYARNIAHVCCPAVIVYGLLIGRYDCSICRGTSPWARSWTIFVVMVLITQVGKRLVYWVGED